MRSSKSNYLLHDSTSPKASCVLHYFLFNSIKSQLIEFIRLNNVNACIDDNKSHSTVNGISPPNNVHHTKNEKNKIQINWRAFFAVLLYGLWNWYVFVLLQKNVLLIAKANDLKQLGNCQMSTIAPFSLSLTHSLLSFFVKCDICRHLLCSALSSSFSIASFRKIELFERN